MVAWSRIEPLGYGGLVRNLTRSRVATKSPGPDLNEPAHVKSPSRAARTGRAESPNRTGRTGPAEPDRPNRTGSDGLARPSRRAPRRTVTPGRAASARTEPPRQVESPPPPGAPAPGHASV
ncbi:hypothetical protein GCM10010300_41300 [Streptomyces olivaceoviridis]|nr:hypothetical protein GCM10010300_41300 [Streptomyces olivaceoviridis]